MQQPWLARGSAAGSHLPIKRISREVDDVGGIVAQSKKVITWRFVLGDSEELHTVVLEHSLLKAKKVLRLDGWQLVRHETPTVGDEWRYRFTVKGWESIAIEVVIKRVADSISSAGIKSPYDISFNGTPWDYIYERHFAGMPQSYGMGGAGNVWSSADLPRRVRKEEVEVSDEEMCVRWFFSLGMKEEVHTLILEHSSTGKKVLRLDGKIAVQRTQEESGDCELKCALLHHAISVIIRDTDPYRYDLYIDTVEFEHMLETQFNLPPGWETIATSGTGKIHYLHTETGETAWDIRATQGKGNGQAGTTQAAGISSDATPSRRRRGSSAPKVPPTDPASSATTPPATQTRRPSASSTTSASSSGRRREKGSATTANSAPVPENSSAAAPLDLLDMSSTLEVTATPSSIMFDPYAVTTTPPPPDPSKPAPSTTMFAAPPPPAPPMAVRPPSMPMAMPMQTSVAPPMRPYGNQVPMAMPNAATGFGFMQPHGHPGGYAAMPMHQQQQQQVPPLAALGSLQISQPAGGQVMQQQPLVMPTMKLSTTSDAFKGL